jgi:trans-aconitate methyltransferase
MSSQARDYLREFMNVFWLRPETAVWRACDCLALDGIEFRAPIADVGCGDGLFSFTRAGGKLDPSYDMFSQVGELDSFFDKVDIYNHFQDGSAAPIVLRKPDYRIDVGIDQKQALLRKAFSLGLYDQVREADANRLLPLEDSTYRTIFSNILYWLDDYPDTLKEMRRALTDDGQIIVHVPNSTLRDYSFYQRLHVRTGDPRWNWLHLIDRGRSDNIRQCHTFEDWQGIFAQAGLKVAHHRQYLSKLLLEAWDIGLRPISPFLIEMANGLTAEHRQQIKGRWIEELLPLLKPFCTLQTPEDDRHPPGFHLFVLEKAQ